MEALGLDQEWMTSEHSMGVRERRNRQKLDSIRVCVVSVGPKEWFLPFLRSWTLSYNK